MPRPTSIQLGAVHDFVKLSMLQGCPHGLEANVSLRDGLALAYADYLATLYESGKSKRLFVLMFTPGPRLVGLAARGDTRRLRILG